MRKLFTLLTSICLLAWMAVPEAQAQTALPGGASCATATAVAANTLYTSSGSGTIGGAYDGTCHGGVQQAEWYSYTAGAGVTQFTVESCVSGGVDTRLSVFTGACGATACAGSDDDGCAGTFSSTVSLCGVTPGTTYLIQWDDRWGGGAAHDWQLTTPTFCAAAAFPYTENLDNGGALAACWVQESCTDNIDWTVNTGGTGSVNTGPDAAQSGAWYIYTETSGGVAAGATAAIYPQAVNMTGSTTPRLNFYYHMRGAAMTPDGTIDVDVSPSGSAAGPWTNIFTQSGEIGNVWNQGLVSLAAYAANTNLLFRINATVSTTAPSFENDFGIDTWRVEDTPACDPPNSGTATSITASGATLGWTAGGTEGLWDLDVVLAGAGVSGSPSNPGTTNPTVVTGLSSGTDYEFWVRADCIINGTSTWEGPFPFTTNPSCGDSWYDTGGAVGAYGANENVVTTICGAGGDFVEATFNSFAVETNWDALFVYDGPSTASPLIPSGQTSIGLPDDGWSGTTIPGPFTSNDATGCLTFEFLSDGGGNLAGWDVSIACVTCPPPGTFSANTITSSSAQIGGTISPAHLNYDMEIGPTGFTPGTGTSALGVGNNHPFTGLTQNTTYDVYVYGNCVGPTQSTLFGPITFTTLCGTQPYPYAEDWEDGGAFDQCWTQEVSDNLDFIVQTGGTPSGGTGPAGAQSGTYYLHIEATGAAASDFATMYSPPIDMSGSVTPRLNLYYQNNGASMNPDAATTVDISTTGAGGPWTNLTTIAGNQGATWLQDFTDLTAYAANTVTFRVTSQMSSGGGFTNDLAIDGFVLEEAPACAAPNALTAAPASNTADLSWNEVGTATLWDIEFGATGFVPTGTPTSAGTTNPHTETGLASLTAYDYYVRADCGSGALSVWVGPYTFTTAPGCGDDFYDNGGVAGNYSANSNDVATICGNLTTEVVVATFTSFTVESGWDALYVYDGPSTASPIIASGQTMSGGSSFPDDGYGGTTPPGPFVSTDPTGCLTFEFLSDGSVNQAGFAATIACVTCLPSTDPALSGVTDVTATITWTASPSAVTEAVNWGPTGFTAGTGTTIPAATSPTTILGLAPNTTYDAYIQTDCGGGDLSPWVGPITFTTLCAANAFPYSEDFEDGGALDACWSQETSTDDFNWTVQTGGTTSTGTGPSGANSPIYYIYTETSGTANNDIAIVYSPLIDMTGAINPRLNCAYHALGVAMANGGSITWDISTTGTAGPWTNVFTQTGNEGVDQWFNATADLTAYIGQTVMFRVTGINSASGSSFQNDHAIDDFLVEETPPCVDPSALGAIGLSGTTAQITFTGDPGAVDYEIEHGLTGFVPTGTPTVTGIAGSPYTLTGLTASSTYDVYVRANCGVVNGNSNWIGPVTFSTLCPAFALDYIEDFEDGGALDACWSQESNDDLDWTPDAFGTPSGATGPSAAVSGIYYIYTETSGSSFGDVAIVYSPQVDLTTATDPRLNMMYHMLGAAMAPDGTIDVDISTSGPLGPWTNVFTQAGPQGTAWQQALPNLSAYNGNVVMFRITGTVSNSGSTFQNDFAIDDFGVEETPLCPVPSAGFASATTATTADLDWTVGGTEVLWNTEVGLAGFVPTGTATQTGVVQGYQETGLTSNTAYEFYLQADCQGAFGVSNWVGPFAFSTALTCGDNFTDTGGAGGNYSVNESGVNTICGDGTNFALVTFTAFNTENGWDALYVYDGPTTGSPIIPSGQTMVGSSPFPDDGYTGTSIPGPFTSTDASGCLTFEFLSDGAVTRPGWEANVTCVTCLPIEVASTSVTGLTSTTATLNWACSYCTGGYIVEWDVAGFTVGTGTTVAVGAGSPASAALTGLTPATAYEAYVRQDCGGGDISSDVLITFTTPPLNDLCSGAEAVDVGLIGGYCTTGITTSNVGATASGVAAPSCAFGTIEDVWYSFVAPTSGEVMIEAAPTGGSPITDMVMALYDACGGTEIACDDDSGPGLFPFIQQAGLTPGNTYYVRCWEFNGGTSGDFDFCVTQPSAASNDNICGAFTLTPITNCTYQTYSNLDATLDPIPNTCGSILADVWFEVVVPASGDLILSSLPGAFSPLTDMVMEVYSSSDNTCTGTLTSVGCDDDGGPGAMPYLSLTGQVPGSTLFVRMSDFGFGSPDFGSFQLAAFPYAIWSGDISTAYPTAGNWCSQVVPGSGDNIGIEAFPTNPMVLTGTQIVGDFLGNNPVTSLQIDPGVILLVQGDAFVSNVSLDGAISMSGSAAQTLNIGLPVTLGGLHIDNGAGVTYDNGVSGTGLSITGGLSLETGHLSIVGGSLTILSDAAGSGWVDDFSAGYTGTVDPITIEGYVPDNYIHFISSPVNTPGLQAQYSEFGASGPDGVGVTPSVNCSPDSLGQGSAYSFVLEWREGGNSGTGWASGCYQSGWHTRSSGNLTNARGYSMAHPSGGPWTMSVTGPVNSGTVTYGGGLTATGGAPAQALGWHVVGNPFPSALDWNASAGTNLLGVANVWIGSSAYQGSYQNLNPGDDVSMHQGFAVRTLTGGASWSPGPANRIAGSVPLVREAGASSIGDYSVTMNLSGGGFSHNTTVYFANETSPGNYPTTGFDGCCDGFFLPGSVQPYIYTVITDAPLPPAVVANEFQTNAMPLLTESYSVPMGLIVGVAGTYTLDAASLETLPAGFTVELEDTKLGVTQELTVNPSYTFSAALNDDVNRFILHFNPGSVTDIFEDVLVAGNIYATDDEIVVRLNTMEDFQGALDVYDLVGNLVMTSGQVSVTNGFFSMDSEGLSTGVYVATLRSGEYSTENKIFIK